jgi:hypothetical protein
MSATLGYLPEFDQFKKSSSAARDLARERRQALWDKHANRTTDLYDRFLQDSSLGQLIQSHTTADDPWMDKFRHTPEGLATFGAPGSDEWAEAIAETQRYNLARTAADEGGRRAGPAKTIGKSIIGGISDAAHNTLKGAVGAIELLPTGYEDPNEPYWEKRISELERNPTINALSENQERARLLLGVEPEQKAARIVGEGIGERVPALLTGPFAPLTYGVSDWHRQLEESRASGLPADEAAAEAGVAGTSAALSEALLGLIKLRRKTPFRKAARTARKRFIEAAIEAAKVAGKGGLREGSQEYVEGGATEIGSGIVEDRYHPDQFSSVP